jgi:3-oxoacyl-[acyl-carrier-protein] synthase II
LIVGTTLGGAVQARRAHADLLAGRKPRASDVGQSPLHAMADYLGDRFGVDGPRTVVSNACVSSTIALGMALDLIRSGEAELVIAGGADSLHSFNYTGFASLKMLGRGLCVPFDRAGGGGMMLGEAAAFLVVESEEAARRRGAEVIAELAGYGAACDAQHPTRPRADGASLTRAIEVALRDASLSLDDLGFVALHGVGLDRVDAAEGAGLQSAFSARHSELPAASLRPVTGHTLGSAGAVDAVACVLAVQHGVVPPTGGPAGNGETALPAPARLRGTALSAPVRAAIKVSSGFGGMNAALVVRRWEAA